jgi:hypothetical protein
MQPIGVNKIVLDGESRRRRVKSMHRWFDVIKRSIGKPTAADIPGVGSFFNKSHA